jgi:hypothetical protein
MYFSQLKRSPARGDQARRTSQLEIDDQLNDLRACTANVQDLSSQNYALGKHEHVARNSSLWGTPRDQNNKQPSPVIAPRDSSMHSRTTSPCHSAVGETKPAGLSITCIVSMRVPARIQTHGRRTPLLYNKQNRSTASPPNICAADIDGQPGAVETSVKWQLDVSVLSLLLLSQPAPASRVVC